MAQDSTLHINAKFYTVNVHAYG